MSTPTNPLAKHLPRSPEEIASSIVQNNPVVHGLIVMGIQCALSEHTALLREERARGMADAADAYENLLMEINGKCGHPDAAEGCRIILGLIRKRAERPALGKAMLESLARHQSQAARSPDCNNRLNQGEKEPEVKAARSPGDAEKGE